MRRRGPRSASTPAMSSSPPNAPRHLLPETPEIRRPQSTPMVEIRPPPKTTATAMATVRQEATETTAMGMPTTATAMATVRQEATETTAMGMATTATGTPETMAMEAETATATVAATVTERATATERARTRADDGGAGQPERVRIAFVDDHPTLLMGMSALFAANPRFEIVGSDISAAGAVNVARTQRPDVLTMDLSMPGDVNQAIGEVLAISPATKVIIFTAYADVERALRSLDAGAHGFVLKGRPSEELLDAIETVRRGNLY